MKEKLLTAFYRFIEGAPIILMIIGIHLIGIGLIQLIFNRHIWAWIAGL